MGSWIWADDGRIRHPAPSHGVIRDDGDGGGGAKQSSMLATKRSIIDTGYEVEIKSEKKDERIVDSALPGRRRERTTGSNCGGAGDHRLASRDTRKRGLLWQEKSRSRYLGEDDNYA
ncbi:Os07g0156821 [Oryza sativa Japonica Group]|jgi:hypothetical protein|uniref:Os07g0156821 protein n=2 Tax=Oryza sativa subsp. japonica TaxID=39947 RepID=Q69QM0_ORYSJ|nr:hypothetical protein [Oryza sativa Japonica Group]BAT00125.1 Os07g0156821 [Oryza sativa Japonica Group]